MHSARVVLGDCKEQLKLLDSDSYDSLVTDPPAGISFMAKAWDSYESLHHFQDDLTVIFKEALRVLKPGAHGLVWALPKTAAYTGMALSQAGFETRDMVLHLFGSGMPKAQDVARAGAGEAWEGWATALKPGHEVWWLVRKPLHESTIAKQVLQSGTGALNIDGCRVATTNTLGGGRLKGPTDMSRWCGGPEWDRPWMHDQERRALYANETAKKVAKAEAVGRWPANVVLSHTEDCGEACSDDCVVQQLDEQSGECGGAPGARLTKARTNLAKGEEYDRVSYGYDEPRSGASRFFYTSKVSPAERKLPDGTTNQHPTLKSVKLMRYLVRLVTPPNGTVLDPFAGSGSTGVAAIKEGFGFLGIELDLEHHRVAQLRLDAARQQIEAGTVADRVLDGDF